MLIELIFCLVFICQILIISVLFPFRIRKRLRYVLDNYPPETHPKLYTKPAIDYEKGIIHYGYTNLIIVLIGLFFVGVLLNDTTANDWSGVVFAYFMLQYLPLFLMEYYSFKHYQLMRDRDKRPTKKVALKPRRLIDFISPGWVALALFFYLGFFIFITYTGQFQDSLFRGLVWTISITLTNIFFAGIVLWNVYGKKQDPYQSFEDHRNQVKKVSKQLSLISIAATLYIILSVILNMYDFPQLDQIVMSLYFQVIAIFSFTSFPSLDSIDFEVYKEEPAVS